MRSATAGRLSASRWIWFQSTHSLRSATLPYSGFLPPDTRFQSTHSLRSATAPGGQELFSQHVSIHALLAECDLDVNTTCTTLTGFNPRTPCGVRQNARRTALPCELVSIHALLAECDSFPPLLRTCPFRFNPRTPCGVRQVNGLCITYAPEVSIHALLAECDKSNFGWVKGHESFNPRTPCGVRLTWTR